MEWRGKNKKCYVICVNYKFNGLLRSVYSGRQILLTISHLLSYCLIYSLWGKNIRIKVGDRTHSFSVYSKYMKIKP